MRIIWILPLVLAECVAPYDPAPAEPAPDAGPDVAAPAPDPSDEEPPCLCHCGDSSICACECMYREPDGAVKVVRGH